MDDDYKDDCEKENDTYREDDSWHKLDLVELAGRIRLRDDFDHKATRRSRHDSG